METFDAELGSPYSLSRLERKKREATAMKIMRLLAILLALAVLISATLLSVAGGDEEPDDPKAAPAIEKVLPGSG